MPLLTIVGAGPGMGLSIARQFGSRGFDVALVSRTQSTLDGLAAELAADGIRAGGYAADLLDTASLSAAFERIHDELGPTDVLEFSPAPTAPTMVGPLDVTVENLQSELDFYLYGGVHAAQQVLPAMLAADAGTLIFTTGAGSIDPIPMLGNVNAAAAALRNWVLNLHKALAGTGVHAAHVAINAWIGSGPPEAEADTIAARYWELYESPDVAEIHYTI